MSESLATYPADAAAAMSEPASGPQPSATTSTEVTVIAPATGWRLLPAREVWRYRELLYFFIWRDVKVQYKQTVLGAAWAVWNPVLNMVIFSILFGRLVPVPSDDAPYPIFVYAGLLPWTFFANSVTQSSLSLVNQTHLVTKIYFPRVLLPMAAVGTSLVNVIPALGVYALMMAWYGHVPGPIVLLLPVFVLLAGLAGLGVGLIFSSATLTYRDMRHLVPSVVQAWMYLSPVIYAPSLVPDRYRWVMDLNPMAGVIGACRSSLLSKPMDWMALGTSAGLTSALLAVGLIAFHRTERRFADVA